MKANFLYELLIDPLTGEQLYYDSIANTLRSSPSGNTYNLTESVPRIIIEDNKSIAKPDLHQNHNSEFKYSDHYQKDADMFDYSEKDITGAGKNEFRRLRQSIIREISDDMSIVLDVGCGNGWASGYLIPLGKKVISMDISSSNPVSAVKNNPHENHTGLIADVYNIPLKENSIDCIIASEIMEHVPDPATFIINLVKLLKNKGKLIITTPYNEKIEYYLCVHCNRPTPKSAHLHSFNEENIIGYFPEKDITWSIKKFSNHYLSRMRSDLLLRSFSFTIWRFFDTIFNRVFKKPGRLQIIIIKTA
jgi:2-polyprenyl-3-methyl-5-hydroxy-6-metoxy-1,4-benzoquinol methylase